MRRIAITTLLIFFGVGLTLFGFFFLKERAHVLGTPVTSWQREHQADCAVVLTGGPGRVREGLNLLSLNRVQKVIISGAHPGSSLEEIFPQWPFYGDLNKKNIILEKRSETTYGNAQQSLPLIEALFCRDVVLITSKLHMHRALRTFKAVLPIGFDLYPRAVLHGELEPPMKEMAIEVLKSMFYSLFAY